MVFDEHQIPGLQVRVDATGGIRDDERLAPEVARNAHGQCDLVWRVPFVEMNASLKAQDLRPFHLAEDNPARMPRHRGLGIAFQLLGRNGDRILELIGEGTQPGAQNQRRLWSPREKVFELSEDFGHASMRTPAMAAVCHDASAPANIARNPS